MQLPFNPNGHQIYRYTKTVTVIDVPLSDERYCPDLITVRCGMCDQATDLEITETEVRMRTACPYPDGMTSKITLAVPSGQVIVTDDLRGVYGNWPDDWPRTASYNSALGQYQAVQWMAGQGCAFGYAGNSCPGLYRTGPDTYVIASLALDDDESDSEILPEGWEHLATVITDLWAYSIADYADWTAKGGDPAALGWNDNVVDIPPGSYEFTHHTGERDFSSDPVWHEPVVFAHIRKLPS